MSQVQAQAPGKLLLIGEYAVLDGAPALVMAVDRRVRVSIQQAHDGQGRLNASQLGVVRARMRVEGDALRCSGVGADILGLTGRLIPAILRALGREPEEIATLDVEIDSAELFESELGAPVKLGLGSSAAVCAALATGLAAWFEPAQARSDAPALLHKWLPVYRRALGASASGADLAASLCGGLIEYRSAGERAVCRPAALPAGLFWRAVWTGQSAQTTDFVAAFEAARQARPATSGKIRARLDEIARRAVASLTDAEALLEACADYADALTALGDVMGVEVMSAPHRRLAELGRQCGVVYKSCGAGGGDLGIALATDPYKLQAFDNCASDRGGVPLNLGRSEFGAGAARRRLPDAGEDQ
ncbi:MAG: hypothetical protein WD397_00505 [Wenzhouxiangellaceae bacterium]